MARSSGRAFSGVFVSRNSILTRPTSMIQIRIATGPVGSSHVNDLLLAVGIVGGLDGQRVEIVFEVAFLLPAVGVQVLAEIAELIEQRHADERQVEIARRLHVIARKHAEAAGIDRQAFGESVLGGEVGDQLAVRFGRLPAPLAHVRVEALAGQLILRDIARIGRRALQRMSAKRGPASRPGCSRIPSTRPDRDAGKASGWMAPTPTECCRRVPTCATAAAAGPDVRRTRGLAVC